MAGATVLLLLVKSIVQKRGRARWAESWAWLMGLRFRSPVTRKKYRDDLAEEAEEQQRLKFEEGYAVRSSEVDAERAAVRQPSWEIEPREYRGQVNYYLYNYAYPVTKVRLTAPSEYFDFEGVDPRFPDPFEGRTAGGFSGKFFPGQPTDRGVSEGVGFSIHWVDENGDPQQEVKRVEPERLKRSAAAAAEDEKAG